MQARELNISSCHWYLRSFGYGPHLLIAFHGFGEEGSIFADWEEMLGSTYTIVAVDLPFHGKSVGRLGGVFGPEDVARLIETLREQFDHDTYNLLGHSLGARVLMAGGSLLSPSPATIWLLAPDGLATRRLGLVSAAPAWLRKLTGQGLERWHLQWMKIARGLHTLRLIDTFSLRYLWFHLSDTFRRRRLMGTWRSLAYFPVNRKEWLQVAQSEESRIELVLGKADQLIDWDRLKDWLQAWPSGHRHILKAGHHLINEQVANLIQQSKQVN